MSTEPSNGIAESLFDERLDEGILGAINDALGRLADRDLSPEELQKAVSAALDPTFEEATVVLAEAVWKTSREGLISNKGIEAGFERRLELRWADALDAYRVVMGCAREMGEEYSRRFAKEVEQGGGARLEALTRLHARSCLVASEVLALLRTGHAAGALARWRTLHELSVTADLVARDQNIAERYLDYASVQQWLDLRDFQNFAARLGEAPFSPEAVQAIEQRKEAMVAKHGGHLARPDGWAAPLFKPPRPPKSFRELEELAARDHLRPYYNLGSHSVHSGSRAGELNFFERGDQRFRLAGPSNAGLAEPAHAALISLVQVTITMVLSSRSSKSEPMTVVRAQALLRLLAEAAKRFAETERLIQQQDEELWDSGEVDENE